MKKIKKWKVNATLLELCLGIVLYGIVGQIVVLIISRKPEYSIGFWAGVLLAVLGSIHMWWALDRGLEMASKDAMKTVGAQSIVRYLVVVAAAILLGVSGFGDPVAVVIGYLGMKAGAYMQPFTHKIGLKIFKY
ncbi:MAG: ATP synthase subunit I [Lachnospiraceae bacterium]|nr:ATP synthase subunit I [Lachnospiraceae bacterium]